VEPLKSIIFLNELAPSSLIAANVLLGLPLNASFRMFIVFFLSIFSLLLNVFYSQSVNY